MAKITTKTLYQYVIEEIEKRTKNSTSSSYKDQLGRTSVAPSSVYDYGRKDVGTAEVIMAIQDMLIYALPSNIIEGLNVTATSPISNMINISAGQGSVGGKLYTLEEDAQLIINFDDVTSVYYINLYQNRLVIDKSLYNDRLTVAKIVVPKPGTTSSIQDTKDNSWNAYIVNFKEYKLYGDANGNFEEDTVELLRDNMNPILTDNLIGNLRLSENLKITNTAGTIEMDSKEIRILNGSSNVLTKLNKNGTYFYDVDGVELARFTNIDARIGNMLIGKNYISSGNYVSEVSGFKIQDNGYAEFGDVRVRGRLSSSVFEYDKVSAVGGKLIVGNSSVLSQNVTATDTTITVDDSVFSVNTVIILKDGINEEYMLITGVGSAPTYNVTRDLANAYVTNPIWNRGTAVVSTGTTTGTGAGYIMLDSISSGSPFIDINKRNSSTYNDITNKVRLGNLSGITDLDFGGALSDYGLYATNVYLKGSLFAPDIKTALTGSRIEMDTDTFIAYDDDSAEVFKIVMTGVNVGDVIIGDYASGQYVFYDKSAGTCTFGGGGLTNLADRAYVSTLVFSATDANTAAWSTGYIKFSNGDVKTISAGNTGNIVATTYVYYDDDVSQTVLQTTTTYSSAIGEKKLLLAIVEIGVTQCAITTSPILGTVISGANIATGTISATKLSVTQLDAICVNTGSLTVDETINVGSAGKVIIDGTNEIIKVYDASNNLRVEIGKLT